MEMMIRVFIVSPSGELSWDRYKPVAHYTKKSIGETHLPETGTDLCYI